MLKKIFCLWFMVLVVCSSFVLAEQKAEQKKWGIPSMDFNNGENELPAKIGYHLFATFVIGSENRIEYWFKNQEIGLAYTFSDLDPYKAVRFAYDFSILKTLKRTSFSSLYAGIGLCRINLNEGNTGGLTDSLSFKLGADYKVNNIVSLVAEIGYPQPTIFGAGVSVDWEFK